MLWNYRTRSYNEATLQLAESKAGTNNISNDKVMVVAAMTSRFFLMKKKI
jgi:hypothetical protein